MIWSTDCRKGQTSDSMEINQPLLLLQKPKENGDTWPLGLLGNSRLNFPEPLTLQITENYDVWRLLSWTPCHNNQPSQPVASRISAPTRGLLVLNPKSMSIHQITQESLHYPKWLGIQGSQKP